MNFVLAVILALLGAFMLPHAQLRAARADIPAAASSNVDDCPLALVPPPANPGGLASYS